MDLPKQYEGLEDALNVAAEIISECTGIPGTGSVAIGAIKELLGHAPIYTLKNVLNKKSAKTLNIPDDMYAFVFEQTHDILESINSVDYNLKAFQEDIFLKNCFDPKTIGTELVKELHIGEKEESEVTKAVRFVLAVYLLHWTEEPDFSLETRQKLQRVESKVESLDKEYVDQEDRISKLENNAVSIPAELTDIPKSIATLIGRESVIQDITAELETVHVLSITADGGLGKTIIAKKIINNIRNDIGKEGCKYTYAAWLTSSGRLKEDLLQINIPDIATDDQEDKYKKVCRFLQCNPTFLVVDNMDEIPTPDEINALNTIAGKSTILITSRAAIDSFPSYELQPLDRNVAVALFYNHYFHNSTITDFSYEKIKEEIATGRIKDAYKIVDATGGNALIIELIAKTAHAEVLSVAELWEKVSSGIFGFESKTEVQTDHSGKYPESKLSIDEQMRRLYSMLKLTDKQKEIMSFISLFPAEHDIFSDAFKWAGFFDQGANDMMYLVDRGWIIREDDYYSIHTIVRDSINMQNEKSGEGVSILNYEELIKKLSSINDYIPRTTEYNLAQKLSFVPQTVGKLLCMNFPFNMTVGVFFNNLAFIYNNHGNYDEALKYYYIDLEIRKKILGKDHPDTATTYNNIAAVYEEQGNYNEALKFYKISLDIKEKTLGKDHPDTATTYNNMAVAYAALGNCAEALNYYIIALKIFENKLGRVHPSTATILNNIALLYKEQDRFDDALKFYNLSLEIREKTLGNNHPDTASSYNNIAALFQAQFNYNDALEYYKKALDIQERTLGKDHPYTAATYNNLAVLYKLQGNYTDALKYYNKDLEICKKILGKNHPDTAIPYNNIAIIFKEQGNYNESLKYHNIALEIRKNALGNDHLNVAASYNNIAVLFQDQGNFDEALKYYNMALEIFENKLSKEHVSIATTHNDIANLYQIKGSYDEALKHYIIALKSSKERLGNDHPDIAILYGNIACLFQAQSNYDEALSYYRKTLEIREKALGKDHPDTTATYINIAAVYEKQGNYDEALMFFKMALVVQEKTLGRNHPKAAATYNNIAVVYKRQGINDEAIKGFKMALEIFEKTLGIHPNTADAHENLAELYHDMGNQKESQKHADMAKEIRKKLGDK